MSLRPGKPSRHPGRRRLRVELREVQVTTLIELSCQVGVSVSELVERLLDDADWGRVIEDLQHAREHKGFL